MLLNIILSEARGYQPPIEQKPFLMLDEIFDGVEFVLDDTQKWGFLATSATDVQTAYAGTYKISILTYLKKLPIETYALKCPFCGETPFWNGASRYQGRMCLVCPRCADKSTLPEAALNTFCRLYGSEPGEFYRPTVVDFNAKFATNV